MTKSSTLEHKLLLGVASLAMLMSASPAFAQDTDVVEDEEDVVVVTGIKSSIEASLDLKRNAGGIVEAITAEDIGKLPDISIADSLARLPGVTAQRVRGRAQQISIRGLGPDFSLALLNGREVVSAGSQRGIEFDQFPSELINQGIVYKTPQANLSAIGIAGAVDLRTVRPLDFTDNQVNLSAKYVLNDNGQLNPDFGDDGYRLFGSIIGQNDAGTLGWSVGVTHQSNPTQYFSRELKTSATFDDQGNYQFGQAAPVPGGNGTLYAADNPRSGVVSRDFERTSVAGALQFEPSDNVSFMVDAFWSDYDDSGIFRGVETPIAGWSGAGLVSTTGTGVFVDSATYNPVGAIVRTDTEGAEAELFALGANFAVDFDGGWDLEVDASYSELDRTDIDYESYAGTAFQSLFGPRNNDPGIRGVMTYVTPSNGEYSIQSEIDYADPNAIVLTDPGGWGQVGFINSPNVDDELTQLRAELGKEVSLPLIQRIEVGAIHTSRQKGFRNDRSFLRQTGAFNNGELAIPQEALLGRTDSGSIGLDVVAYDPSALVGNGTYFIDPAVGPFYSIDETINTVFAMAELGADDSRLKGNVGIQFQDVEQSSTGLLETLLLDQNGNRISTTQSVGDTYSHVLPSANLSYDVKDDVVVRLGVGRSVTRPRLDDLAANQSVGTSNLVCVDSDNDQLPDTIIPGGFSPPTNVCVNVSGGNPFLRPYESTNFDGSVEWYFSTAGALSVAVFHKSIDEYVQGFNSVVTDADFVSTLVDPAFVSANPDVATFSIGGPANIGEGSLTGFELALRLPLDEVFDAPILEGFGFNGNFNYTDAKVDFANGQVPIPGYSSETGSAEIYYEKDGFRARVNTAYRSSYVAALIDFGANPIQAEATSRTTVDAQIGYEFQSGALEGLSVNLEAYNLTDEPFRTRNNYDPGGSMISIREDYGTTYNFTVAKKF